MSNSIQRSFASGELAPDLYARVDLARYAIGLRTCRNLVVQRAGGVTKRPGTKIVHVDGATGVIGSTGDSYVIHKFTISDTFVVTSPGLVEWLLVGGGASGGAVDGTGVGAGGGGAGGVIHTSERITVGSYPVTIGGGGPLAHADHFIGIGAIPGNDGSASSFRGFTAHGGGGGGGASASVGRQGNPGASGGGGASAHDTATPPATVPPSNWFGGASTAVPPELGNPGANGSDSSVAAGAPGGGAGGTPNGLLSDIAGLPGGATTEFARGGGAVIGAGTPVTANTGNGGVGGGQALNADGSAGASGVCFIRYRLSSGVVATGGTITVIPL